MVICIEQENWQGVNMLAHMLKMSSGVIGGGKVHYASFYMQEAHLRNDPVAMMSYYPLLVEAVVELKRYTRKFLAEHEGKQLTFI